MTEGYDRQLYLVLNAIAAWADINNDNEFRKEMENWIYTLYKDYDWDQQTNDMGITELIETVRNFVKDLEELAND